MTALEMQYQAIEDCAKAAREVSGQFTYTAATLETPMPGQAAGASIFGKLAGSSGLAEQVGKVETMLSSEFTAAKSKIRLVGEALTTVEKNVRAADKPETVQA